MLHMKCVICQKIKKRWLTTGKRNNRHFELKSNARIFNITVNTVKFNTYSYCAFKPMLGR